MLENISNLDDLKTAISAINVKDYGDFKRKAILYLNRYAEVKRLQGSQLQVFTDMVDKIQYHADQNIEKTRAWSLQQLKRL